MFGISKLVAGLALSAGLLLAGCAGDNKAPQSSMAETSQGVTCTKCQITWVKTPSTTGRGGVTTYVWGERDACPNCRDAVSNFFATGKLEHACKTCGESMEVCKVH